MRVFTQTFGVVGAIIERAGKILLVREGPDNPDPGKWNQPAGWIDVGEDPVAALKREVKEETGLDFEPAGLIGVYSLAKNRPDGSIHHGIKLIFRGEIKGGLSTARGETAEASWFAPEEIIKMNQSILRDMDIKQEVQDYFAGKSYPLEIIYHTVQ